MNFPKQKYVKVVSPDYKAEISQQADRRVYRWTHSNLTVKEKDPDEIPRRIPPNPDVQVTTFANWEEVGRWYRGLEKEPLAITPPVQAKAAELTKGLTGDTEKIRAIYNFVSLKFHYIGLDFGIGRYQPHAADDVLDNGYGDCKDKHTLLAALLKAAGYEAWPVLIHTQRKLDPDVPSPAQFNHMITAVPREGSYLWLDTTPEVARYRLLMPLLRNKEALVIPNDGPAKLMTTPANPPAPQAQEFSMSGKLDAGGTFTGHAEQSYEGDTEILLRMAFRQVPESNWKELTQSLSQGLNFGGDVSNVKVTPPDQLDQPFHISYDYVRKNYADWENHHTSAALPPMGIESYKGAKEKKPQEPVLLGALGTIIYRSRVELPDGYRVTPPPVVHLAEPYAEYDGRTNLDEGVMTTTRKLTIKKTEIALDQWESYRKFGQAVYDDEFAFMTLEGGGKTASKNKKKDENATSDRSSDEANDGDLSSVFNDGVHAIEQHDFQTARDAFQKVLAKDPKYKGAHLNLGIVLAAESNEGVAIEEFRKEEQNSPDDARSYQIVATYLTRLGKTDEAIDEWRKLLKVDAENRTAATALAGLLYRSGKYTEAVTALEPIVKSAPTPTLRIQLGQAYLKASRKDKAVESFRAALENDADNPERLNEVAYSLAEDQVELDLARQYAEKAVTKLEEASQGAESSDDRELGLTYQLSLTWDTLGWVYFHQGDTKRAEAFVRAAWILGEDPIVAEHLGQIYEVTGKKQQAAKMYEFALAVSSMPIFVPDAVPTDAVKAQATQNERITERYRKLTGKRPVLNDTWRLPNGEWTKTPAEQLRQTREVKTPNAQKLSGKAQYLIVFKSGKVDSADFHSGDDELKPLAQELETAKYPIEFPADSAATLVMRVDVKCHSASACTASLVNPARPNQFREP